MRPPDIDLKSRPPVGRTITIRGQDYTVAAVYPYIRTTDGEASILVTWGSHCPHQGCGEVFQVKTGWRQNSVNRRCPKHHRPGSRVKIVPP